ncbi:MAG: glycosyltransferase [Patescibacteria group bacterium]|nr:glycosyltransferase [Patescibacteria group bacterium]
MDLTIIIPAKNEEKRIGQTLNQLGKFFANRKFLNIEILVIINNTTDNTIGEVRKVQRNYPFIKYTSINWSVGQRGTKGNAVVEGFKRAKGKYVAFLDADGSSSVEELYKLYMSMLGDPSVDGAIANRYISGARIVGDFPFMRKVYSRLFNMVVRFGFGINSKDTQCGLKMFKNEVAKEFIPRVAVGSWAFDLNLLLIAKYLGYRIDEVPTIWVHVDGSKLNARRAVVEVPKELFVLKKQGLELWFGLVTSFVRNIYEKRLRVLVK